MRTKKERSNLIQIRINSLAGLKKAERYKTQVDKYQWVSFNAITEVVTFKKVIL